MRYQSRRHRCLMDESEQALTDKAQRTGSLESRIASQVLNDPKTHRLWESRHAELVRPVADQSRRTPQVIALRSIEAGLLHRRALIDALALLNWAFNEEDAPPDPGPEDCGDDPTDDDVDCLDSPKICE